MLPRLEWFFNCFEPQPGYAMSLRGWTDGTPVRESQL